YLLKWILEERIEMRTEKVGLIFKKNRPSIYFLNKEIDKTTSENNLFHMMLRASGSDNILSEKKFTQWVKRNSRRLIDWEKRLISQSLKTSKKLGLVESDKKKFLFLKKRKVKITES